MPIGSVKLHHVNVTVPAALEEASKIFMGTCWDLNKSRNLMVHGNTSAPGISSGNPSFTFQLRKNLGIRTAIATFAIQSPMSPALWTPFVRPVSKLFPRNNS